MRYLQKQRYEKIKNLYTVIIGWGAGAEFVRYYDHDVLQFDYMIDGAGQNVGKVINGITVQGVDVVAEYREKAGVLVVIYPNIEDEICRQVRELLPEADTIVARLIEVEERKTTYSANEEDCIMLDYMKAKYDRFSYMDIGVCHPVVRNNTYLFYENGLTEGVLVEPNVEMCGLAREYRPLNRIINVGASPVPSNEKLTYYYDINSPGLNTFIKDVAGRREMDKNFTKIPVRDINTLIAENFETYPNVLDIDTEGLDLDLLSHLDFGRYPVDLICVEACGEKLHELMRDKGYELLQTTKENEIYVLKRSVT